jgi:selenocysteine lyase/cysteine desulfurase
LERKQERLRFLRDYWVSRTRDIAGIQILTPDEIGRYGATTAFRLMGMHSFEDAKKMQDLLVTKYNTLAVATKGITRGAAVHLAELGYLTTALNAEQRMFL